VWLIITKKLNIPKVKAKNVYNKQIHAECRYKSYIKHDKSKVLFAYWGIQHVLTIWVTWRISYKRQELLTLRDGFTPAPCCLPFVMGSPLLHVAYLFSFLCCVFCFVFLCPVSCVPNVASVSGLFFVLFFFVLYLVYQMLPVSLGCQFLIAPLIFSNTYLVFKLHFTYSSHSCPPEIQEYIYMYIYWCIHYMFHCFGMVCLRIRQCLKIKSNQNMNMTLLLSVLVVYIVSNIINKADRQTHVTVN
jgi:hypothetical protein